MMARLDTRESANPLDATMTRTQVVRRKFKSSLPRKSENRVLSPMQALGRTFELFDRLRGEMRDAGLDPNNAHAALVYCQPETPGYERVFAMTVVLPPRDGVGEFCDHVMGLDRPLFLGVLFLQNDPEAPTDAQKSVLFVAQFLSSPEANGRLLAARDRQVRGELKSFLN